MHFLQKLEFIRDLHTSTFQMALLHSLSPVLRSNLTASIKQSLTLRMKEFILPVHLLLQNALVHLAPLVVRLETNARIDTRAPIATKLDTQRNIVASAYVMRTMRKDDPLRRKEICLLSPAGVVARKDILPMIPSALNTSLRNLLMLSPLHYLLLLLSQQLWI